MRKRPFYLTPGVTTLGPLCVWFRVLHQPPGEIVVILGLNPGGGVEKCGENAVVVVEVGDGITVLKELPGQPTLVTRRGRPLRAVWD